MSQLLNQEPMPEISRFFGIIVYMYFKDHLPPHFHAEYNGQEAQFSIETGNIIVGDLPRKQTRLIQAWVEYIGKIYSRIIWNRKWIMGN